MSAKLLAVMAVLTLGLAACSSSSPQTSADKLSASGPFAEIKVANGFVVTVKQGDSPGVDVSVTGISPNDIRVDIVNEALTLETTTGTVPAGAVLQAEVTATSLETIMATSGAKVTLEGGMDLSRENGILNLTSGAEFTGSVNSRSLEVQMQAGAHANVTGSSQSITLVASEAGKFVAPDYQVSKASVTLSSGSKAQLTANKVLSVTLQTGSELVYGGNPKISKKDVSAGATLRQA